VPLELVAEILKWYSVFGVRPVIFADTATGLDPDPGSAGGSEVIAAAGD
jgi:hypothetical protein